MAEPHDVGGGASQSTEPATGTSTATDVSLREYVEMNWRWQTRFESERDRRYAELAVEREKALKIKETADLAALQLARDIQIYKDEKANELREQINSERGLYLSRQEYTQAHQALIDKLDAAITGVDAQLKALVGTRREGVGLTADVTARLFAMTVTVVGLVAAIYFATH